MTFYPISGCEDFSRQHLPVRIWINQPEEANGDQTLLGALGSLSESIELKEGLSVGAVWCVSQVARELGIEKSPGNDFQGKLAMWQVIARVINQGSRLSAVRLAQVHATGEVLDLKRGFGENDLYENWHGWQRTRER